MLAVNPAGPVHDQDCAAPPDSESVTEAPEQTGPELEAVTSGVE